MSPGPLARRPPRTLIPARQNTPHNRQARPRKGSGLFCARRRLTGCIDQYRIGIIRISIGFTETRL